MCKNVPISFGVDESFPKLGAILIKLSYLTLSIATKECDLNVEELLEFIVIGLHFLGFLQLSPNIIDTVRDGSLNCILIWVFGVKISDTIQNGLGWLLLELINADFHNNFECLVLGSSILAHSVIPNIDNEHIGHY